MQSHSKTAKENTKWNSYHQTQKKRR